MKAIKSVWTKTKQTTKTIYSSWCTWFALCSHYWLGWTAHTLKRLRYRKHWMTRIRWISSSTSNFNLKHILRVYVLTQEQIYEHGEEGSMLRSELPVDDNLVSSCFILVLRPRRRTCSIYYYLSIILHWEWKGWAVFPRNYIVRSRLPWYFLSRLLTHRFLLFRVHVLCGMVNTRGK